MAETILGIDLGTTNSEVAVIRDGQPIVIPGDDGDPILPSVVGFDANGALLVGKAARNQFSLAPERTVRSIKRRMGEATSVVMGDRSYTPQEISAMILRTLKERAEKFLGHPVSKAVITVPAFFTESQRDATREAGSLAGLEVVRIINEPTAAALAYDPHPDNMERLLIYDLGGGTFDVSIVQIEKGVVEVLASHGDTHLGGDDFDQQLLDHVAGRFLAEHGIDLRTLPVSRSRLLHAVETAKRELSFAPFATLAEEFIAEKEGASLHLKRDVDRMEFEEIIEPLLQRTLACIDKAMSDAKLNVQQIDKIILAGGATRTPAIHRLLNDRLALAPSFEVEPDLCVALGAAVQAGLIAGLEVGPVLVDITPHTLGIQSFGEWQGMSSNHLFAPIVVRNTPLPAVRSEPFETVYDGQKRVMISVFQGESDDVRQNTPVGEFSIEDLADVPAGNLILIGFDLDINGILTVTATEKMTGKAKRVQIEKPIERFRRSEKHDAQKRLSEFWTNEPEPAEDDEAELAGVGANVVAHSSGPELVASKLLGRAAKLLPSAHAQDADDLRQLMADLGDALLSDDEPVKVKQLVGKLEDLVFYLEDAE